MVATTAAITVNLFDMTHARGDPGRGEGQSQGEVQSLYWCSVRHYGRFMANDAQARRHAAAVVARLAQEYPDERLALNFSNPFELLMALILAAQCTDERVNQLTGSLLFAKYPTPDRLLAVAVGELEADIHPTGFFRNKARSLRGCCQCLVDSHGGAVPRRLADLLALPGVGRKTANILRGNAFGDDAIGVDTHVGRLARRLGLSASEDPDTVEADLCAAVEPTEWTRLCPRLRSHGRKVCQARKPSCWLCPLADLCPYPEKTVAPLAKKVQPAFGRKAR